MPASILYSLTAKPQIVRMTDGMEMLEAKKPHDVQTRVLKTTTDVRAHEEEEVNQCA